MLAGLAGWSGREKRGGPPGDRVIDLILAVSITRHSPASGAARAEVRRRLSNSATQIRKSDAARHPARTVCVCASKNGRKCPGLDTARFRWVVTPNATGVCVVVVTARGRARSRCRTGRYGWASAGLAGTWCLRRHLRPGRGERTDDKWASWWFGRPPSSDWSACWTRGERPAPWGPPLVIVVTTVPRHGAGKTFTPTIRGISAAASLCILLNKNQRRGCQGQAEQEFFHGLDSLV